MQSKFFAKFLAAILMVAAILPVAAQNASLREVQKGEVTLQRNQEHIISTPVVRVTVGNGSVVRATALDDGSSVIVTALGPGRTEVRLFPLDEPNVVHVYTFTVKRENLDDLRKEIDALLSYMVGVSIEKAGENLVLKGEVLEPQDRARLDKIIALYPEVIDFTVNRYAAVEEERIKELILNDLEDEGLTTIRVEIKEVRGSFKAMLRGVAFTDRAKVRAEEIAKLYYEDVVNLIQLEKPVIEVDVVVTTLDLAKARELGTNNSFAQLTSFSITGYLDSNFGRSSFYDDDADNIGQVAERQRPDEPGLSIAPTIAIAPNGVSTFINAIKTSDAAVFYSEQHQAVLSGEEAEFNDGGSLIFQTVLQDSSSVTEIEFGLMVKVTPEQKEDGTIMNTIEVENKVPTGVSSASGSADVAFDTFKNSSVVECRSEETIVLAGVDSNNIVHSDAGTPFLRRIPIVNLFFRARSKSGKESRSLIFITPTSSTIFRENRASFSTSARRKANFFQNESTYWERDLDWGYYSEFHEKPGNQVPYVNSFSDDYSYYDDATAAQAAAGMESSFEMGGESSEGGMTMESEVVVTPEETPEESPTLDQF